MANDIKYRYALDEQGRTVCIDDISDDDKMTHTYFCISCGAIVIPKRGKIKKWHFAHKGTEEHCNPEKYLHKLAKRLVREKFYNSDSFEVSYYQDVKCSLLQTCAFAEKYECHYKMLKTYDLKKYYDTCEEERPIENFRADLLLTNSKIPDRDPILLEMQVTHECEEEKKNSKLHIIELRIEDEDGIKNLLKTTLKENANADRDIDTIGFAKFYNFEKKCKIPEPIEAKTISRFYLYNSGKAYVDYSPCKLSSKKLNDASIFEVCFDDIGGIFILYYFGYLLAIQNGIITKACCFCKYFRKGSKGGNEEDSTFCCMYKKYGTPKNPIQTHASKCEYYRESKENITYLKGDMPKYIIAK